MLSTKWSNLKTAKALDLSLLLPTLGPADEVMK
jgi:hypothetical protein